MFALVSVNASALCSLLPPDSSVVKLSVSTLGLHPHTAPVPSESRIHTARSACRLQSSPALRAIVCRHPFYVRGVHLSLPGRGTGVTTPEPNVCSTDTQRFCAYGGSASFWWLSLSRCRRQSCQGPDYRTVIPKTPALCKDMLCGSGALVKVLTCAKLRAIPLTRNSMNHCQSLSPTPLMQVPR